MTTDTRKVTAGCLFVALKGSVSMPMIFAEQAKAARAPARCWWMFRWPAIPQVIVNGHPAGFGEFSRLGASIMCRLALALTGCPVNLGKDVAAILPVRQHAVYRQQPERSPAFR